MPIAGFWQVLDRSLGSSVAATTAVVLLYNWELYYIEYGLTLLIYGGITQLKSKYMSF